MLPLLVAGAAALLGAGAHADAKETNEQAQMIANNAQTLYNNAKASLDAAKADTEQSLLRLGTSKKETLDCSIKLFLQAYDQVKNFRIVQSAGMDEISKFTIEAQDAIQLREMSDIYSSAFSSSAAGAASGAVIALAASGSLPIIASGLSLAGTALTLGEVGGAAAILGSTASFGLSMTPLAAIAAPVVLFSGISASMKADENLEKAKTMYAQASNAAEQMKTSETLCRAIATKADMFDELLKKLDKMFSICVGTMNAVVQKKTKRIKKRSLNSNDFTEEELKLIAVTRALAGAVKKVIDTPILSSDGTLALEAESAYEQTSIELPAFAQNVEEVQSFNYRVRPKEVQKALRAGQESANKISGLTIAILVLASLALIAIVVAFSIKSRSNSATNTPNNNISSIDNGNGHNSGNQDDEMIPIIKSSSEPINNSENTQAEASVSMLPADQGDTPSAPIASVAPTPVTADPLEPTSNPTGFIDSGIGKPTTPSVHTYAIDTVASSLSGFRSMVISNQGDVYYIDGHSIYCTSTSKTLDLKSDFGFELKNPYLAYDPYGDIVYLLADGPLAVYDISDFNAPEMVMNQETCPDLCPEKGSGGKLERASSITPQISVLADGTLLVPTEGIKKTWMLNPKTQTAAPTTSMAKGTYDMTWLLGDAVISLSSGSTSAEIRPFGSNESAKITLEVEAPRSNATSVIARNGLVYFYDNSLGLCAIAADGSADVPIPKSEIEVKDGQGLGAPNIWCLDVNQNGEAAFYDNTLKCIRLIQMS